MNNMNHHHPKKIIQIKLEGLLLTIDRADLPPSSCLNVDITIANGLGEQGSDSKDDSNLVSAEAATDYINSRGDGRLRAKAEFEAVRRKVDPSLGAVADMADVESRTGFGRRYIYRLIKARKFPSPYIFARASYWDAAEVAAWTAARSEKSLPSTARA